MDAKWPHEPRAGGPCSGMHTLTAAGPGLTLTRAADSGTGEFIDKVDWEVGDVIDGKYEVEAVLGQGGMGVVHRVRHRAWGFDVAVKMPLAHLLADKTVKTRFVREAQTWVDLGLHPNIVQCWYVRELGGVPRVFMDYLGGGSLKDWIRDGKVSPGEWGKIIDLMIQACDGLAHAHGRHVVHRDLKPANLLMADQDRLCVTDFGLVKVAGVADVEGGLTRRPVITPEHTLTVAGAELGTPEYAAPEQWGEAETADARADIYALGVVLFELCCGRRPFDDGSHSEPAQVIIGRHLTMPPPDPRDYRPDVPDALIRIARRCLEKRREQRPDSAAALRGMLARAHQEVLGKECPREVPRVAELRADALNNRAVSLWDLGNKAEAFAAWSEALTLEPHHLESVYNNGLAQWRTSLASDLEVLQRLSHVGPEDKRAALFRGYIHLERAAADTAEQELEAALDDPKLQEDAAAWRALGDARMAQGRREQAREAYAQALERVPGDRATLSRQSFLDDHPSDQEVALAFRWRRAAFVLEGEGQAGLEVGLTPDRRLAVVVTSTPVKEYRQPSSLTIAVWDLATGQCVRTVDDSAATNAIAVTPDGRFAVLAGNTLLRVWDIATGQALRTLETNDEAANVVAVTPDGRLAVAGSHGGKTLRLWELATGQSRRTVEGHAMDVNAIAFTPDGRLAVTASHDRTLRVWELATGQCLRALEGHTSSVCAVVVTSDGRFAVSASDDQTLRVWDLATGRCVRVLEGHTGSVAAVVLMADERFAISASRDKTLRVWDCATGQCVRTLQGHTRDVTAVAVTPDGRFAVSGSCDDTMRAWELATGRCVRTFEGRSVFMPAVAVTPDGRSAVFSCRGALSVWTLELDGEGPAAMMQVSRSQRHAVAEERDRAYLTHLDQAEKALARKDLGGAHQHVAHARSIDGYTRDPRALALNAQLLHLVQRRALRDAWHVRTLEGHTSRLTAVALTPDGRFAVSASWDKTLRVWELATGKCVRSLEGHTDWVGAVAVTSDGRFAVSVSKDATLRVWELATGHCTRQLPGHEINVTMALTSDGRFVVSSIMDNLDRDEPYTWRVWELATGKCVDTMRDVSEILALTPDGSFVVSTGQYTHMLSVWEFASGKCLRTGQVHDKGERTDSVAVTPDGRFAVSAGNGRTLGVWELGTGNCVRTLRGHRDSVQAVAVTSDGRFAVSTSKDQTLRVWELGTGNCVRTLEANRRLGAVALSPDGRFAVSTSDEMLTVWELDWECDTEAPIAPKHTAAATRSTPKKGSSPSPRAPKQVDAVTRTLVRPPGAREPSEERAVASSRPVPWVPIALAVAVALAALLLCSQ